MAMSFWDEVRKGLEEGAQALKKGAEVVAEKTEEAAKIAKLRYNIYTVRQGIKKDFTELGAHVFELAEHGKGPVWKDDEVLSFIEQVRDARKKIGELEKEIETVSAQIEETPVHEEADESGGGAPPTEEPLKRKAPPKKKPS
jgi:cell division protein FtsB